MEKKIGFLTGVFMEFTMCVVLGIVSLLVNNVPLTLPAALFSIFASFAINFVAGLIIPVNLIGNKVANSLRLKAGSFAHYFVSTVVVTFIFVTVIVFGMCIINVGFGPIFIPAFIKVWPVLFIVGIFVALIAGPFWEKFAHLIFGAKVAF